MVSISRKSREELEAQVRQLVEEEGLQQWKVAEKLGRSTSFVERVCARLGLRTQRTGPRGGEGHPNWKGGRYLLGRKGGRYGYWYVWAPDHPNCTKAGYVAEHRLVMEGVLGRFLSRNEVVHHRDGDTENNDPQNLEVFQTNAEHLRHELSGRLRGPMSAEARARVAEGIRRSAILRRSRCDADQRSQTNDRPTSQGDSSDAVPACEKEKG